MKLVFATMSLFCALGLSKLQASPPAPLTAEESPGLQQSVDPEINDDLSACPRAWICDDGTYYSTRQQCFASCSGFCTVEIICDGSCVCP